MRARFKKEIRSPFALNTSRILSAGTSRANPIARIPPTEVPAIRSNSSHAGRPVRRSISARSTAGMIPRIPPPSIERILTACLEGIGERIRPAAVAHAELLDERLRGPEDAFAYP